MSGTNRTSAGSGRVREGSTSTSSSVPQRRRSGRPIPTLWSAARSWPTWRAVGPTGSTGSSTCCGARAPRSTSSPTTSTTAMVTGTSRRSWMRRRRSEGTRTSGTWSRLPCAKSCATPAQTSPCGSPRRAGPPIRWGKRTSRASSSGSSRTGSGGPAACRGSGRSSRTRWWTTGAMASLAGASSVRTDRPSRPTPPSPPSRRPTLPGATRPAS